MRVILYNQEFENHLTQFHDLKSINIANNENPFLIMSNLKNCNELHLLAHGSPGNLDLGTGINIEALYENAEYLSTLNVQKIILWGCHVGKDNEFIKTFSNLTNSIIYSSKDYLGMGKGISEGEFPLMNDFIKSLSFYLTFGVPVPSGIATETQKLVASDADSNDDFGYSVSISGDYAIVGAPLDGNNTDIAYIFHNDGTTWNEQEKLTASDANENDYFGNSVSISGETAIVGAYNDNDPNNSGSAYIFHKEGTTWTQQQKLTASDAEFVSFGSSVSISGSTAIVGAYGNDDNGILSGSAYIFERVGTTWTQQQKLLASDADLFDSFGWSVSISGATAIVGSPNNDNSGSAYIFNRKGTTWTEQEKLTASDAAANDNFGISVSISGATAIVGAWLDNNKGSAYIFDKDGTTWTQQAKLLANDTTQDFFGYSVSISALSQNISSRLIYNQ